MTKVTEELVKHLAELARIGLSKQEISKFKGEFEQVLGYVDQLQKADIKGVEPTSQVTGLTDSYREDKVKPSKVNRDELLKNAPQSEHGYLKVKRIL